MMISVLSYNIKKFYTYASVPGKGKMPAYAEYPSSFFLDCGETDSQR